MFKKFSMDGKISEISITLRAGSKKPRIIFAGQKLNLHSSQPIQFVKAIQLELFGNRFSRMKSKSILHGQVSNGKMKLSFENSWRRFSV